MKVKVMRMNTASFVFFLLSSLSLIGVPFLDLEDGFPLIAYLLAGTFWIGLLIGIILQAVIFLKSKNIKDRKQRVHSERKMLIPIAVFAMLLIITLIFWQDNITVMSIDLACMFFSVESFFYIRCRCIWRYKAEKE